MDGVLEGEDVGNRFSPSKGQFLGVGHLQEEAEVVVAGLSVAVDVNDESPLVSVGVQRDLRVFRNFGSRLSFVCVVGEKVCEFNGGRNGLGGPRDVGVVFRHELLWLGSCSLLGVGSGWRFLHDDGLVENGSEWVSERVVWRWLRQSIVQ